MQVARADENHGKGSTRHIVPFARYADDAIIHCKTRIGANRVIKELADRLASIGLELHPLKTRVVSVGRGHIPEVMAGEFTFLGYDFRRRMLVDKHGRLFFRIAPRASKEAMRAMTRIIRQWRIHRSSEASYSDIARRYNATLRGWITYYCNFWYRVFSYRLWGAVQSRLEKWIKCKYRLGQKRAELKLARIRRSNPSLFARWELLSGPKVRQSRMTRECHVRICVSPAG